MQTRSLVLAYKENNMIRETRNYTPPTGHTDVVDIKDWAETLNESDKLNFFKGFNYQTSREKTFTALGKLSISDLGNGHKIYTWDSQASADLCGTDSIYQEYHTRYLSETGLTLDVAKTTV
jgi:hypothetical protein